MQLRLALAIVAVAVAATAAHAEDPAPEAPGEPTTGTARFGVYRDSDNTTVTRMLGVISHAWDHLTADATIGVDAVTSASVDVRASPLGKVDAVTSASGTTTTSGGTMSDTRFQATGGLAWKDGRGHGAKLSGAIASETDYTSGMGGLNGSYDILDRTATLLGGVTFTDNRIESVLDHSLHRKMFAVGWSAGVAIVLTPDDAIRVRYDGKLSDGYQASPYRNVRFGDWTAQLGDHQITFALPGGGDVETLPDKVPELRVGSAAVVEWVHGLLPGLGVHPELRLAHDSWGVNSLTTGAGLRFARDAWRLQAAYHFYAQSHARFFQDQYMESSSAYQYYASDKELGRQIGHLGSLDASYVISDANGPGDTRMLFTAQLDVMHYRYPGYVFLPSRDGMFVSFGLSWEP